MNRRKHIVINLLNFVSPQIAGTGIFIRNILKEWLPLLEQDITVTFYHSGSIDVFRTFGVTESDQVVCKKVNISNFVIRILYEQFILPFKLRRAGLYFSPTPSVPIFAKLISPGTKLITTIHDMIPFFVKEKYSWLRTIYVKFISTKGASVADHVITVSENSKKDICRIAKIKDSNVSVVYNFMTDDYSPQEHTDLKYFLSISTIEPGKNIENTLQGFRSFLKKTGAAYKFYWIGKIGWGYTRTSLQNMIQELDLSDKCIFLDYVDEQKKTELLKGCTCLVYISHYEGFGLPILEALQFNKPSVASRTSSLPEVVGPTGILCDQTNAENIADAIQEMVTSSSRYIREIPVHIRKFDKRVQVEKFRNILNRML